MRLHLLVAATLGIAACAPRQRPAAPGASPASLSGAWTLVSARYTPQGGQPIQLDSAQLRSVKMLSAGHVAYVTETAERGFHAAGAGTYRVEGGRYVETLRLTSVPTMKGRSYSFAFRREGELWHIEGMEDGTHIQETWRRLE